MVVQIKSGKRENGKSFSDNLYRKRSIAGLDCLIWTIQDAMISARSVERPARSGQAVEASAPREVQVEVDSLEEYVDPAQGEIVFALIIVRL